MLRSIRSRLILSHVLPLLLIVPIMGVALANLIERRVLLPSLARALMNNAILMANIAGDDATLWTNPSYANYFLAHVKPEVTTRVMFLTPDGVILASSEQSESQMAGIVLDFQGVAKARSGQVASYVYDNLSSPAEIIDVYVPVLNSSQQLVGILRMSYSYNTLYTEFIQARYVIFAILALGLLLGVILGWRLAVNLGKPIGEVTQAINDLAHGTKQELVIPRAPEEIQLLAQSYNFLNQRLISLEKARRQLLANLVHELGRPLGALRSAIQALAGGAAHDPQLLKDLTTGMDQEAARLQRLLEELSQLHDQVLGTLELDYQPIDLSRWLPTVLRPWQEAAHAKHQEWQVEIASNLPNISADPVRLASAIENLVGNAIKYTPSHGSISVDVSVQDGEILVQVSDNGSGVSFDEQEKIFLPFYRGDQGKRFKQGMGLGLSIAHDLVEAHGGKITLLSSPGQGSRFTIHLPLDETTPRKHLESN